MIVLIFLIPKKLCFGLVVRAHPMKVTFLNINNIHDLSWGEKA